MTWRLKWLMWRWAVSTFGYRKAYRMWRHGMKARRLRLYRGATYGKVPAVEDENW